MTKLSLFVLSPILSYLFFVLAPVAWGEENGGCKPSVPNAKNTYHASEDLWKAVEGITGYQGDPPVVVKQDFTRENIPDKRLDLAYAGGCYGDGVVQVKNEANETAFDYYLMHEYAHHAFSKLGVPVEEHHCRMAEENYSGRLLRWLYNNGHRAAREIYPYARRNEMSSCDEGGDE